MTWERAADSLGALVKQLGQSSPAVITERSGASQQRADVPPRQEASWPSWQARNSEGRRATESGSARRSCQGEPTKTVFTSGWCATRRRWVVESECMVVDSLELHDCTTSDGIASSTCYQLQHGCRSRLISASSILLHWACHNESCDHGGELERGAVR